ncbi:QWRF motif-containing protein 2-like [Phoenix dactylifera]|uniref:QWRF motif-containing protein 2-like n=1 Tax=Phoenix dactylifera TaxID=42345 RepID=A0A8B7C641_PHODC|nr:QWRF motif-containing protein 2-like [Phoenix dactylifera]
MVAAIPPPVAAATPIAAAAASTVRAPKTPSPSPHRRRPLAPSEKDNAAVSRKPPSKGISSRYLSLSSFSSSTSTSTSTSRRFLSPLPTSSSSGPKRSHSVDRSRPNAGPHGGEDIPSAAARPLRTTTRSLSVSFQGESFSFQTSKAKPAASPPPSRKPTPDRRRPVGSPARSDHLSENSKPSNHRRWPAARSQQPNLLLTRSLGCSPVGKKDPVLDAVRLLRQSMVLDEALRQNSFNVGGSGSLSASSDTDSASSESNSGSQELRIPPRKRPAPRGITVPARFLQETNSRLHRLPEPGTPISSASSRTASAPKPITVKKSLMNGPSSSPAVASSPRSHGSIWHPSPRKLSATLSLREVGSPSQVRNGTVTSSSSPGGQLGKAPSILSFAAEVSRGRKGESRIEEAHLLRLCYNRHLQWRYVNAQADAALLAQGLNAEKYLYNAWITTSELRDSITTKRLELQVSTQNLKLTSILKGQMAYLQGWSLIDGDHLSSLSGAIEALKASTLRLPVVGGAKAEFQDVKNAVSSAVDAMQAIGNSICSLLSRVEESSSVMTELAKVAAHERALMDKSRELLSTVAAMHVKQCSLLGHITQLSRRPRMMQT